MVKIIKISLILRDRKNLQRFAVAIFAQLRLWDKALRKQTTVKWKDRNAALSLETWSSRIRQILESGLLLSQHHWLVGNAKLKLDYILDEDNAPG